MSNGLEDLEAFFGLADFDERFAQGLAEAFILHDIAGFADADRVVVNFPGYTNDPGLGPNIRRTAQLRLPIFSHFGPEMGIRRKDINLA